MATVKTRTAYERCSRYLATLLLGVAMATGCTMRQAYDAVQQNRRFECAELPPSQYDECMQRTSETYEKYRREREELLQSGKAD